GLIFNSDRYPALPCRATVCFVPVGLELYRPELNTTRNHKSRSLTALVVTISLDGAFLDHFRLTWACSARPSASRWARTPCAGRPSSPPVCPSSPVSLCCGRPGRPRDCPPDRP